MTGPSLLPPNSTSTERAIESLASHVRDLPVAIHDLWNPATCPASFLPWLAWALSVDTWRSDWSEAKKRAVIAASPRVHRLKGTVAAVKAAVTAVSGGAVVRAIEWFQPDGSGVPHTAVIEADVTDVADVAPTLTADLLSAARSAAPIRSHLTVRIAARPTSRLTVVNSLRRPLTVAAFSAEARYVPGLRGRLTVLAAIRRPLQVARVRVFGGFAWPFDGAIRAAALMRRPATLCRLTVSGAHP